MRDSYKVICILLLFMACLSARAQSTIEQVEYYFDTDPGFGQGYQLANTPADSVSINTTVGVSGLSEGLHILYIRSRDSEGDWSFSLERTFYKGPYEDPPAEKPVVRAEYFFDTDPGCGNGIPITITQGTEVNIEEMIDVSQVDSGLHYFYLRAMDSSGNWCHPSFRVFYKGAFISSPDPPSDITALEYFFNEDPGFGNGFKLAITPNDTVDIMQELDVSSLPNGQFRLYIRARNENGWSYPLFRFFIKEQYAKPPSLNTIQRVEYFIDSDPGEGNGTELSYLYDSLIHIETVIDISGLTEEAHSISIRVQDMYGQWSMLHTNSFVMDNTPPAAPSNLQLTILNSQVLLNWEKNNDPDFHRYNIYAGTSSGGEIMVDTTAADRNEISKLVKGLMNDTTYYFYVRSQDSANLESIPSNEVSGTPLESAGSPPIPDIREASAIRQLSFRANWNPSPTANGYYLDVSKNYSFSSFVAGYNNLDVGLMTSRAVSDLTLNTTYYYRVRAYGTYGTSDYSDYTSATTLIDPDDFPDEPVALDPVFITDTAFIARWEKVDNASAYRIDVSSDVFFSMIHPAYNNMVLGDTAQVLVGGLDKSTTYYYRLRAHNEHGTSDHSNIITVTTLAFPPPNPPVAAAASSISSDRFTANWEIEEGNAGYRIDVAEDMTFIDILTGYSDKDIGLVNHTEVSGLTEEMSYYYRLRAYNDYGTSSSSNIISLTTASTSTSVPNPPQILEATEVRQTSFRANWSTSLSATGYELDVSKNSNFATIVPAYNSKDIGQETTATVSGLTASTQYYYRVRAYGSGGVGNNSTTGSVITLPYDPSIITGIHAYSCNNIVKLSWNKNNDNEFRCYHIYSGTDPQGLALSDSTLLRQDTLIEYTGLTPGETYYYQVRVVHVNGLASEMEEAVPVKVQTGVIPRITSKWDDVLICYNIGDSLREYQWYAGENIINGATKQYFVTDQVAGDYHVLSTDLNTCQNISNTLVIGANKSLKIRPNPASSTMSIELRSPMNGNVILTLYTLTGSAIQAKQYSKNEDIILLEMDVGHLTNGSYILDVSIGGVENYKNTIIIEH